MLNKFLLLWLMLDEEYNVIGFFKFLFCKVGVCMVLRL